MGKKKHKKKQKKAKLDEQTASPGPSPLHRMGQALLDQARSPAGRQLLATGLIVAASALARETAKRPGDAAASPPEPTEPATSQPSQEGGTTKSGMSEVVAFAGMALSALDQFIHRPSSDNKG
ncbi:hypothetical protein [Sphingomonas yabuuchiae]|uniref:hypothetical protein n=1 Tax=Sphingomonas yabuuchiae TaxID=172044 RepID=UPI001F9E10EF|nr:hypothetical protein [Candidatus Sphingomonas excrementigallinarum]